MAYNSEADSQPHGSLPCALHAPMLLLETEHSANPVSHVVMAYIVTVCIVMAYRVMVYTVTVPFLSTENNGAARPAPFPCRSIPLSVPTRILVMAY